MIEIEPVPFESLPPQPQPLAVTESRPDHDPGDEDVPRPPRWWFGRFSSQMGYIGYGMSILREMIRYPDKDHDGGDEDDYHNYWCPYVGGVGVPGGTFRERHTPPAGIWNGLD